MCGPNKNLLFFLAFSLCLGCSSTPAPVPLAPEVKIISQPAIELALKENCPALRDEKLGELIDAVSIASDAYGVDSKLIFAIITAESRCHATARSRAGALGLMQLMPRTAEWLGVTHPTAQFDNIFGGTQYVAHLMEQFNSNLELTLAAYNAGPTKVRRYRGIPPYRETRTYIRRVLGYYEQYSKTRE